MQNCCEEIRILVIDDRPIFRIGLVNALKQKFQNVSGLGWADALRGYSGKSIPDLVIISNSFIDNRLCDRFEKLQSYCHSCFLLLAEQYDDDNLSCMLSPGCMGCLKDSISIDELIQCITFARNKIFCCDISIINQLKKRVEKYQDMPKAPDRLSKRKPLDREMQIAQMIVDGSSNQNIAQKMYLSVGTVKNLISAILDKYGFKCRSQIVSLLFLRSPN